MEQTRSRTQTGSVNAQRTSTSTQNTRYSADGSTNFQTPNKPNQGHAQHGQSGQKTGANNPEKKNFQGKYDDRNRGDKR